MGAIDTGMQSSILDVCSGSRMFYADKADPRVLYGDIRNETHTLCDGRLLKIEPDVLLDFRALPFENERFSTVVFGSHSNMDYLAITGKMTCAAGLLSASVY